MVYTCNYTSSWWETTTTISIDGGDTLDLRFSRSRFNLTACTLLVTSLLLENDMGEQHGEERGDASSRRGNGRVLRSAKSRALKAKDVYHGLATSMITDHFQPLLSTIRRGGRAELARAEPSETELRIQRGEPLCESSLRRPGIWILLLIGISGYRPLRSRKNSHSRSTRVYEVGKTNSYDIQRDLISLRDSLVGVERSIN
ncbi:hypothetical protein ALC53_01038 [Atta colombica]|uniref:Uncharacterized protein n=1 Tax=Atta colombica TaxID=520822 RepID=A0A195BVH5_9HYME|nr:hypothetical protein ALC53_01038 [Atta colombica]